MKNTDLKTIRIALCVFLFWATLFIGCIWCLDYYTKMLRLIESKESLYYEEMIKRTEKIRLELKNHVHERHEHDKAVLK